jgi:hypothetical protein
MPASGTAKPQAIVWAAKIAVTSDLAINGNIAAMTPTDDDVGEQSAADCSRAKRGEEA